jgi:hypothetical protein
MYDDKFYQYTGEKGKKDKWFNECVTNDTMSLKNIYTQIEDKRKRRNSIPN